MDRESSSSEEGLVPRDLTRRELLQAGALAGLGRAHWGRVRG